MFFLKKGRFFITGLLGTLEKKKITTRSRLWKIRINQRAKARQPQGCEDSIEFENFAFMDDELAMVIDLSSAELWQDPSEDQAELDTVSGDEELHVQ